MAYISGAVFVGLSCMEDWEVCILILPIHAAFFGLGKTSNPVLKNTDLSVKCLNILHMQECILDKTSGKIQVKRQSLVQKLFKATQGPKIGKY